MIIWAIGQREPLLNLQRIWSLRWGRRFAYHSQKIIQNILQIFSSLIIFVFPIDSTPFNTPTLLSFTSPLQPLSHGVNPTTWPSWISLEGPNSTLTTPFSKSSSALLLDSFIHRKKQTIKKPSFYPNHSCCLYYSLQKYACIYLVSWTNVICHVSMLLILNCVYFHTEILILIKECFLFLFSNYFKFSVERYIILQDSQSHFLNKLKFCSN